MTTPVSLFPTSQNPRLKRRSFEMEEDRDSSGSDWDEPPDGNNINPTLCLFCSVLFPSPEETFAHCRNDHNFNILELGKLASLDTVGYIKMINYIRKNGLKTDVPTFLLESPWKNDEYWKPVLNDDPLLMFDIEDYLLSLESLPSDVPDQMVSLTKQQYDRLNEKLQNTQKQLQEALEDMNKMREAAKTMLLSNANLNNSQKTAEATNGSEEDSYFSCYSHYGIHHEMLQDRVRTEAYRHAITLNPSLFQGKVVLDVGCGTGILSMFAASAGAQRVLAVDQSDVIYQAMDIVRENNLHETITLLKGRLEDISISPVQEVDVIVSEWMGYFLLFEGMLDTVLMARDRYLRPGGLMFPDKCTISLAALSDTDMYQKYVSYWDNVYGYRMSCFKKEVIREANVDTVESGKLCSQPVLIKELNLLTCKIADSDFSCRFEMQFLYDCVVTALVGYFDSFFEQGLPNRVHLSTAPSQPATHWKQTVFLLPKTLNVTKGQILDGKIVCHRCRKDQRSLVITLCLGTLSQVYSLN